MNAKPQLVLSSELLHTLRCPYSGDPLRAEGDTLKSERGRTYRIVDGVPWLLDEAQVAAVDRASQRQYTERDAARYDRQLRLGSLALGCWEPRQRRRMVDLLELKPGARVLEVSVGTGANLPFLAHRAGRSGHIVALDLSWGMMGVAKARGARLSTPVDLVRGDAVHLPFASDSFDAVLHFGGLNLFGDRAQALAEMVRVARPGSTVVVGDEGLSEARRRTWLGRKLLSMNSLFVFRPPFDKLPWERIEGLELHWAWREAFYLLTFRVRGDTPQPSQEDILRQRIAEREEKAAANGVPKKDKDR